jgi:hypothetical protein
MATRRMLPGRPLGRGLLGIALALAGCTASESRAAPASVPPVRGTPAVGINLEAVADWAPQPFFADLIKQGRPWHLPGNVHAPVALDASGWPTGDAGIIVGTPPALLGRAAPYKLTFRGDAKVSAESATIRNQAYVAATRTTTADVHIEGGGNVVLTFRGQEVGVKDVRLLRPGQVAGDVFAHDLLARLKMFPVVRFMQALGEHGIGSPANPDVEWADRVRPDHATQTGKNGIAWEYVVLLANQTGKDAWINVPLRASDDYVRKLALLLRHGSDGVNPYTSPQPKPVFPPLEPSRAVYVEYVNELWNGIYASTGENQRLALAEIAQGDPNHYRYKSGSDFLLGMRRLGHQTLRISAIFRSVFGDADMMSRVRPVLAAQIDNSGTLYAPLEYLEEVHGPGNRFGNAPRSVATIVYAGAGAPYVGLTKDADGLTVDDIFDQMTSQLHAGVLPSITSAKKACDRFGIRLVAYEGGQHLVGKRSLGAKIAAQDDPRMKDILVRLLRHWFETGGDLFAYYSLCSTWGEYGSFGLSNDIAKDGTAKWQAVKEAARTP